MMFATYNIKEEEDMWLSSYNYVVGWKLIYKRDQQWKTYKQKLILKLTIVDIKKISIIWTYNSVCSSYAHINL